MIDLSALGSADLATMMPTGDLFTDGRTAVIDLGPHAGGTIRLFWTDIATLAEGDFMF